jgi:hypothetical protein
MKSDPKVLARAKASANAKTILKANHPHEYDLLYREECKKLGVTNRKTKEERIAELQSLITKLQQEGK